MIENHHYNIVKKSNLYPQQRMLAHLSKSLSTKQGVHVKQGVEQGRVLGPLNADWYNEIL